ncbi:MAG: tRNA-specific 2-thiouridylase [Desulfovibrio sp.]|nr:tRNA-specific 2-thiouridylase [Desulfovibrio sp.]
MAMSNTTSSCTVAVAVSGGVDSLCALVLLQKAGYRVLALHGFFLPEAELAPPPGLEEACACLGVPLHLADLRSVFQREVLDPFVAAYAEGRTPNPCALCNRAVKFGALLDAAQELGAYKLATGHYARLVCAPEEGAAQDNEFTQVAAPAPENAPVRTTGAAPACCADMNHLPLLAAAHDAAKDQSYFLSLVPRARLALACFPLADQDKTRTREIVAQAGLKVPVPHESQDICFAPAVGASNAQTPGSGSSAEAYRPFLERQWQTAAIIPPGPGPVYLLDADGTQRETARHKGLWRYTEGQRKGLGIAHSEPLYVLAKDSSANALIVGPRALLGVSRCVTGLANVFLPQHFWPEETLVRLRHRQKPAPAKVWLNAQGFLEIEFAASQFPSAPGQVAAVYDVSGRVLAAGVVEIME